MIYKSAIACGLVLGAAGALFFFNKWKEKDFDVMSVLDDQLRVVELSSYDITDWFKKKNPKGFYSNVAILASNETLNRVQLHRESVNFFKKLIENEPNVIVQAVIDKKSGNMIATRAIVFEKISDKIKEIFDAGNGVVIID